MKKTMKKLLSMVALALVGAMTVSCSSDDNIIDQAQQPETKNNVVTLTTTVSLDGGATTRALSSTGVKTFAVGETMAIYYWKNKGNDHVKAVSKPLTEGDITNGGKSATFTFTLDNPYKDMSVSYVYPAAMANADFTPNYDALYNNQDGTLATLASNFDFCTRSGAWNGDNLPSVTLVNQLAILAITLKNADGSDITSGIKGLTLSDGTYTYAVSRSAAAGPIYVAIRPTTSATIDITATDGSKNYAKTLATTKTYEAGNGYPVSWRMADASVVNLAGVSEGATINVSNGQTITGALTDEDDYLIYATINIEDGAIVTLKDVVINPDGDVSGSGSGITCAGNATIILEGTNTVKGFDRSGIEVKSGKTLTILGTGTLNASGHNQSSGAGIGGEGNIVIMGGTINATGTSGAAGIGGRMGESCGNITISGGTITATGGSYSDQYHGAGIGGGASYSIDNTTSITITSGVEKVTATRGGDGGECKFIGAGSNSVNGATLTIDGVANATTSSEFPNFTSSVSGNTWTLTHK